MNQQQHPTALRDIAIERQRQIEVEGWTRNHDDEHAAGSLAVAAACYAIAGTPADLDPSHFVFHLWRRTGWASKWWKPKDRRSNLVRAGALIVAEIERLDRAQPTSHNAPAARARADAKVVDLVTATRAQNAISDAIARADERSGVGAADAKTACGGSCAVAVRPGDPVVAGGYGEACGPGCTWPECAACVGGPR